MKRGEIWTAAGGADYAGKPRPVLIVQEDAYVETSSVAVCLITRNQITTKFFRPSLEPSSTNGLVDSSRVMIDKIAAMPRSRLGKHVGRVSTEDMRAVEDALATFLGLAR